MAHTVIIVAGGSGLRFGAALPKQFVNLSGRPILMHTIEVFYRFDSRLQLIVVLPASHRETWLSLCQEHRFTVPHQVVDGGAERFHSVKAGISVMDPDGWVAIHDAVRPLVSRQTLERCIHTCIEAGSAVPAVPLSDSLRRLVDGGSVPLNRNEFRLVQTPQCFQKKWVLGMYNQPYDPSFTDDASVAEKHGLSIQLCEGNTENIKITHPSDLIWAEALIQNGL
ncbi:MAG TPA: 2-C-methyl-D-erythritol 4-phosphate cytidylyltransferase [Luteibaculaceae bacterium]|nr:2-C-methyl-D-erythritol 4-phosphate cytidylyltransferase [Luteibaculaceae bacterium]